MLTNKEIKILASVASNTRRLCKCGHSVLIGRQDRIICNYCGNYIYKDNKTEFEYKLKERRNNK